MQPNIDIYGAPETWHDCYYGGGSTQPWAALLHGEKAKVPTWDIAHPTETPTFENSQLRYAVDDNKLTPTQPIDNSICAVGQGTASPFRQFTIFRCDGTTEHPNGEILQVGQAYTGASYNDNNLVNTFWFESNSFTSSGNYGNGAFSRGKLQIRDGATITQGIDQRIWSPTGVNAHGTNRQNGNFYIAPFLSYGTRSYVLQILVWVTTADYDPDFVPGTGTPAGEWKTLDDWKNNFSTKAITACLLAPRSISTYNSTTGAIGYFRVNFESSQYRKVASGILDEIKFDFDDGSTLPDLTDYGLFSASSNANIGVALFNEMTLYKWSDTLQNIGLVNSHIASYIRSNGTFMTPYIPYSNDIYNWIMSACACFGMAFTPAKSKTADASNCVFNQAFTDVDLCLPIITDGGVANGDYTRGADNVNNDFIDLSSQWDKNYQPSKPVDTNTYSNVTAFNYITEGAAMTVRYVLDGANVDKLLSDLWTINASIAQGGDFEYFDGKIKDEYLTTNPIDCIVSLIRYPFNIPYQLQPLQSYVKLGKTAGSAKGWTTVYISNQINFQGKNIFPRFGNCFLDYEPYTTYELYVPFCGTTKIRAADILGHTLNVTMLIDLITGSCTAYVKADQLVIETLQGSCGVQQQISGTDTATMNANIYNGILAQKQAKTGVIAQAASALLPSNWVNPVGYAAKGQQAETSYKQATYAIEHIETPVHSQGAASPLLGWIQEFDARLMIYYPEGDVIDGAIPPSFKPAPLAAFGHLKGFATVTPGTVGAFRSTNAAFISGDIIADDIPCTLSERNRIKSMFADGVYLPPL